MILANVFGQMAALNLEINRLTIKFQEQLDTINTAMENINLPKPLKKRIKEYFINTFYRKEQQHELNLFMGEIAPSLRQQITFQIFHEALENNLIFHSLLKHDSHGDHGGHHGEDDQNKNRGLMHYLVKRLEVELATPENVFVSQGDEAAKSANYMFFIAKGDCNVMISDYYEGAVRETMHRSLLPGDHFGVSLLFYCGVIINRKYHWCTDATEQRQ
jgi:hypothetical protein